MAQHRAADDFKMIRTRIEELRRERLRAQPRPPPDALIPGHRGPCACGMSLFPDECDGYCKAL
ncbi:MAG TPA: hypothetical protein VGS13_11885 [Stellaceae bacterium]|nr:hypothetical protein [Stellaceae bacterium]